MNALEQFKSHGNRASFHHASESGNESSLAYNQELLAMSLYRSNPELRGPMRVIAKDFLWAYDFDRKADAIDLEAVPA